MGHKWADIRKGPPLEPLSPEEHRAMVERLARLDKFCEGMEDELQWELQEPAHRYTREEITFEEFERIAADTKRSVKPSLQRLTMNNLLAKSDYSQPQLPEEREWVDAPQAGDELL